MGSAKPWVMLVVSLVATFLAAGIGGLFTGKAVTTWYPTLRKPRWTPPAWLFGPVWTLLYISMAVAAWLVWRQSGWGGAGLALSLFAAQLVLNALWSAIFFGLKRPGLAFAEILLLWAAIAATLVAFSQVNALAGGLLVPYLAWVTFATGLNGAIWRLNAAHQAPHQSHWWNRHRLR